MSKIHHIEQAQPEEQGSFCTLEPGYTEDARTHVNNMSAFQAEVTERTAKENGDRCERWSGDESVDTRYNHMILEKDESGDYSQAKHGPGK